MVTLPEHSRSRFTEWVRVLPAGAHRLLDSHEGSVPDALGPQGFTNFGFKLRYLLPNRDDHVFQRHHGLVAATTEYELDAPVLQGSGREGEAYQIGRAHV